MVDETVQWCNTFVIVAKPNGKACLCLAPTRLNQALIGPVHRQLAINHGLPKLTNLHYMTLIDATSGYHTLNLIKIILPNHICLSVLQVQIHQNTIQNGAGVWFVPQKCMKYSNTNQTYFILLMTL